MNVLIISEDFRHDQYILTPLFRRLFRSIDAPRARVQICRDPLLGGVGEALKSDRIREIMEQHGGMTDIFILCVDRDGVVGRRQRLDELEAEFGNGSVFFAENAWEELETWALAGLDLLPGWRWATIRAEMQVKERFFDPLADQRRLADSPGGGRKVLGEEASHHIDAIRRKCPEDFDALARRLEAAV